MITGRQLTSTANADGSLRLEIVEQTLTAPDADEVIVRVEAAPINPTDLGLLLGPADIGSLRRAGSAQDPSLVLDIPHERLPGLAARLDKAMPVGIEGAGTVVSAGRNAKSLEGRRVSLFGDGTYADYYKAPAQNVVVLPDGVSAVEGAAISVNPMTALGFVETARREGHHAMVHTAAASNVGQLLQRICLKDGIPLVNIVRSKQQEDLLKRIGASHVVNTQDTDFREQLLDAVSETGATIGFDAISGGTLGSDILAAIEQAQTRKMPAYSRYGSDTLKQLYVYGRLDPSPIALNRTTLGMRWSVSGWLLMPFLEMIGEEATLRMRQRVLDEIGSTFVSQYTRTIGLSEALDPDILRAYERKATGEKYLIDPTRN